MNNARSFIYSFIIGFCFGVAFCSLFDISNISLLLISIISLSVLSFLFLHTYAKQKIFLYEVGFICVFALAFAIGGFRFNSFENKMFNLPLNQFEGKDIVFVGEVEGDLGNGDIVFNVSGVKDNERNIQIKEKILLDNITGVFEFKDKLALSGKIALPKNFDSETGRDFDYVSYLKNKGVYHIVSFPKLLEQRVNDEMTLQSLLYAIKQWFIGGVEDFVAEPASSLATGVTIAGKGSLSKEIKADFVNAGIIHIVVLSGYNIAIVIRAMLHLFSFLNRGLRIWIAFIGVCLFVIMAGGTPPVIRSAIMATITLLGMFSYRQISQNRALLAAVFFMIFLNPYALVFDASFALSVLATFAIINGVGFVKRHLSFLSERFNIKQILAETLATQIFVLPYILFQIGTLSVIAPLSNIIVLPFISWIMLFTFITGCLAFLPFLSLPFGAIVFILSSFVIWIAHVFANLPFAAFEVSYFPFWLTALLYIFIIIIWYVFEYRRNERMEKVGDMYVPY